MPLVNIGARFPIPAAVALNSCVVLTLKRETHPAGSHQHLSSQCCHRAWQREGITLGCSYVPGHPWALLTAFEHTPA